MAELFDLGIVREVEPEGFRGIRNLLILFSLTLRLYHSNQNPSSFNNLRSYSS